MNRSLFESMVVGSADGPDKVDMSLDDIIRMNKKRNQIQSQKVKLGPLKRPFTPGKKTGLRLRLTLKRGALVNKRFGLDQKLPTTWARWRGQGLITGLAARKNATLFKGTGLFNQSAQNSPANRQTHSGASFTQRRRPFVQQRQMWRKPGRQMEPHKPQAPFPHRPFRLQRKWNPPSVQETRRESRQATFLFRRGLKVQAQVQKTHKSQQWRSSTDDNGILTVSIDNPTARSQPEPAQSWSLHPAAPSSAPPPKEEPERKPPKGVALQFDINSVGKQTGMTLNERFRILKNQRVAAAHQSSKGGRFVTVA